MFSNLCWIWSKKTLVSSFYKENNFKLCLTKQLLNMLNLWCERGISVWKFDFTYFSHNYGNYSMFSDVPECSKFRVLSVKLTFPNVHFICSIAAFKARDNRISNQNLLATPQNPSDSSKTMFWQFGDSCKCLIMREKRNRKPWALTIWMEFSVRFSGQKELHFF